MTLEDRFTQPDGWQWQDRFQTRPGEYLRYGWTVPPSPRGLVILLPGLSEYCEKYFETVRDLMMRGFAVAVIDWRGQGLSWRHLPDRLKRHHDDFANDVADAYAMIDAVSRLPELQSLSKIMLAHSMGGHIGLRFLHDHPGIFKAAVFSAPMQGIHLADTGQGFIRSAIDMVCRSGWSEKYIPGGMPWSETVFALNLTQLTSDKTHGDMQHYWMTTNTDLQPGGLTFGWMQAAFNSIHETHKRGYLEQIDIPCLFCIASRDKVVSNRAIEKSAERMPHAEILRVDGSLHEVLMERDIYRDQFWHAFDGFMDKNL